MTWTGGSFGGIAECVLAPNASPMTLDGTNTWVLRDPDTGRSIVIDPGPPDEQHLTAVAETAGTTGFGWIVPPDNANALAAALRNVMTMDVSEKAQRAAAARNFILDNYSRERMCAATLAVYNELL